jgi:peptidoglycan hydrolase-like protein with peptidoglycan-binding domain
MKRIHLLGTTLALAVGMSAGALAATTATSNPPATSGSTTAPQSTAQPAGNEAMHRAAMSSDQVKAIQTSLNSNGEHVSVDGKLGPKTAAALKDYQQKQGLKPTGRPDKATMDHLHPTT